MTSQMMIDMVGKATGLAMEYAKALATPTRKMPNNLEEKHQAYFDAEEALVNAIEQLEFQILGQNQRLSGAAYTVTDVIGLVASNIISENEARSMLKIAPRVQPVPWKGELTINKEAFTEHAFGPQKYTRVESEGETMYTRKEWRRLEDDQMTEYKEALVDGFTPGDAKVGRYVREDALPNLDRKCSRTEASYVVPIEARFLNVGEIASDGKTIDRMEVEVPFPWEPLAFKAWLENAMLYCWWLQQILDKSRLHQRLDDGPELPLKDQKVGHKND